MFYAKHNTRFIITGRLLDWIAKMVYVEDQHQTNGICLIPWVI